MLCSPTQPLIRNLKDIGTAVPDAETKLASSGMTAEVLKLKAVDFLFLSFLLFFQMEKAKPKFLCTIMCL